MTGGEYRIVYWGGGHVTAEGRCGGIWSVRLLFMAAV